MGTGMRHCGRIGFCRDRVKGVLSIIAPVDPLVPGNHGYDRGSQRPCLLSRPPDSSLPFAVGAWWGQMPGHARTSSGLVTPWQRVSVVSQGALLLLADRLPDIAVKTRAVDFFVVHLPL